MCWGSHYEVCKKSLPVFNAFQVIRELSMRPGCHSQSSESNNFSECKSAFIFVTWSLHVFVFASRKSRKSFTNDEKILTSGGCLAAYDPCGLQRPVNELTFVYLNSYIWEMTFHACSSSYRILCILPNGITSTSCFHESLFLKTVTFSQEETDIFETLS